MIARILMRPCFICEAENWCSHREPEVIEARLEALERADERAAHALARDRRTNEHTEDAA